MLGLLIDLEPVQATLLDRVCGGPLLSVETLRAAGAFADTGLPKRKASNKADHPDFFRDGS